MAGVKATKCEMHNDRRMVKEAQPLLQQMLFLAVIGPASSAACRLLPSVS